MRIHQRRIGCLILFFAALAGQAACVYTGPMAVTRDYHTATLLANGQVLAAGGINLASTELYNPGLGVWINTGSLNYARSSHTATLLANGMVLVTGGAGSGGALLASAELYQPTNGTWSVTSSMTTVRCYHTATLLTNGLVLVTGGAIDSTGTPTSSAELYDPASGTWIPTPGTMNTPRSYHTATLLTNGWVLVAGGVTNSAGALANNSELYDPVSGLWTVSGPLNTARKGHTATPLRGGKVLITGGSADGGSNGLTSSELYDPTTGVWTPTGSMANKRTLFAAVLQPDGQVLVLGGKSTPSNYLASGELYNPSNAIWTAVASLNSSRAANTATLLPNGNTLLTGGYVMYDYVILRNAELYKPSRTWESGLKLYYTNGMYVMPFRLYLPYAPAKNYPLVIFLHGSGERGTDNTNQVRYYISGLINRTYTDYPAILMVPQCTNQWGAPYDPSDLTFDIMAWVRQNYPVDERRIYLSGLSLGGFGTTSYAYYFPSVFAAIAPMSGACYWLYDQRLSQLPTWLFHGSSDASVPVEYSRWYYTNVTESTTINFTQTTFGYPTAVEGPIRYTELTGMGHGIWDTVLANNSPAYYDWMFAQVRPPANCMFTSVAKVGDGMVFNSYCDVPFTTVYMLSSTNLQDQWQCITTNHFDAAGTFVFTNNVDLNESQRFFMLKTP